MAVATGLSTYGGTTPDEVSWRKKFAQSLMQQGMDASPVAHPLAAVARALQGGIGGYLGGQADDEAKSEQAKATAELFNAWQGQAAGNGGAPASTPPVAPTSTGAAPKTAEAPAQFQPMIADASAKYGVEPAILTNTLRRESNFNPAAVGPVTRSGERAQGIAQFMPATAAERGVDPMNPQSAINGSAGYLADLSKKYNGNTGLALAAYNWGPGNVDKWVAGGGDINKMPAETRGYVQSVSGKPVEGWIGQPATPSGLPSTTPPTSTMPANAGGIPGGTMPLMKALSNPWLGAGGQAIGLKMLEKSITPKDQWVPIGGENGATFQRNLVTGEIKPITAENTAQREVKDAFDNWKKYSFPDPNSTNPKDQQFWREFTAKRLGGAGVNVAIDQSAPNEFEKDYGSGMSKRALATLEAGDKAAGNIQRITMLGSILENAKTGKLAPAQATIGAWAKAAGIDPATIGIDPNLPLQDQAAQSFISQNVVGMIGAGGFPANNFSDADRKFLMRIPASMSNMPEANNFLIEVAKRVAQRDLDKASAWSEARANKQSYESFEHDWRKKTANEPLFADFQEQFKGMQGGNLPKTEILPPGRYQWSPNGGVAPVTGK